MLEGMPKKTMAREKELEEARKLYKGGGIILLQMRPVYNTY